MHLTKGSRLIVKGTKKGTLYWLHGKALTGKFIPLVEIHSYMELWHKRLGNMSKNANMVSKERIPTTRVSFVSLIFLIWFILRFATCPPKL